MAALFARPASGVAWLAIFYKFQVFRIDEPVPPDSLGGKAAGLDESTNAAGSDAESVGGMGGGDHFDVLAFNFLYMAFAF